MFKRVCAVPPSTFLSTYAFPLTSLSSPPCSFHLTSLSCDLIIHSHPHSDVSAPRLCAIHHTVDHRRRRQCRHKGGCNRILTYEIMNSPPTIIRSASSTPPRREDAVPPDPQSSDGRLKPGPHSPRAMETPRKTSRSTHMHRSEDSDQHSSYGFPSPPTKELPSEEGGSRPHRCHACGEYRTTASPAPEATERGSHAARTEQLTAPERAMYRLLYAQITRDVTAMLQNAASELARDLDTTPRSTAPAMGSTHGLSPKGNEHLANPQLNNPRARSSSSSQHGMHQRDASLYNGGSSVSNKSTAMSLAAPPINGNIYLSREGQEYMNNDQYYNPHARSNSRFDQLQKDVSLHNMESSLSLASNKSTSTIKTFFNGFKGLANIPHGVQIPGEAHHEAHREAHHNLDVIKESPSTSNKSHSASRLAHPPRASSHSTSTTGGPPSHEGTCHTNHPHHADPSHHSHHSDHVGHTNHTAEPKAPSQLSTSTGIVPFMRFVLKQPLRNAWWIIGSYFGENFVANPYRLHWMVYILMMACILYCIIVKVIFGFYAFYDILVAPWDVEMELRARVAVDLAAGTLPYIVQMVLFMFPPLLA